ncbi:MAG TPA: hypothetical protein PKC18_09885 [Lacipirellulaceae bacterium]|nr:hypothetical protein [Lacipirellulaceae bacterium]
MHTSRHWLPSLATGAALLLLPALLTGCSDGRPTRVPVSGIVTIDGQPLPYGNIKFVPSGARPSAGKIDENGRFKLTCYDGDDGVVVGRHRVAISASKILSESKIQWYAPKKYADFRTSELEFDIDAPIDDLKIELTWNGGKAFVE